jgi:hypothetical protein
MDSLYVLTMLPASIVRKVWYYMGQGDRASILIKRKIRKWSRRQGNDRWMDTRTLWNIGRQHLGGMCHSSNPRRLPLTLWCEYRVIMTIIVEQNGMHLGNLNELYKMWNSMFRIKTKYRIN